ncbi:CAP domain-containing protein [Thamnocephalis sphaerospora]|uniref:CAP domain-containing protein n=1 Tax=Thamnocephalis sphaerospora TaxID=78915 RepID=A0A4P9XN85_9FUNG|nr:CAP domain-containing protein [Thamnocephalis sphaerospora]|eukprot:RKP07394.1 CAP domain-containing protein [Thamnocephalis sphaerospora]
MNVLIHSALFMALVASTLHSVEARVDSVKMTCLINKERQKQGLPPLGLDDSLGKAAQIHSQAQADARTMSHQLPGEPNFSQRIKAQSGYKSWKRTGENVAFGQKTEEEAMNWWMNSPVHRDNIMGDFTHVGAGMEIGGGTEYWTQNFGNNGQRSNVPTCPGGTTDSGQYDENAATQEGSNASNNYLYAKGSPSRPAQDNSKQSDNGNSNDNSSDNYGDDAPSSNSGSDNYGDDAPGNSNRYDSGRKDYRASGNNAEQPSESNEYASHKQTAPYSAGGSSPSNRYRSSDNGGNRNAPYEAENQNSQRTGTGNSMNNYANAQGSPAAVA